jgi:hypothetical protein
MISVDGGLAGRTSETETGAPTSRKNLAILDVLTMIITAGAAGSLPKACFAPPGT